MKIQAISSAKSIISASNNQNRYKNNQFASTTFTGFPSQNIAANYGRANVINFRGASFPTDNELAFFKLPPNARPDEYQLAAAEALNQGKSVLVSAPTGTGKTAIAQFIISKNLEEGKRTFYTTPLKALSNQKLLEFRDLYGEDNVGILTGDRKENANAPIVVMTTEVYRNMAFNNYFNDNKRANDASTIIFDEFHYLGDSERGPSWEESIIFSPSDTQLLGLSATIGNDKQLAKWLNSLNEKAVELEHVPSENRHVPLIFHEYYAPEERVIHYNLEDIADEQLIKDGMSSKIRNRRLRHAEQKLPYPDDYMSLINKLDYENKFPAIFFVFSKQFSKNLLEESNLNGRDLTTDAEKEQIQNLMDFYEYRYRYLGKDLNKDALLKGYAIHNAGILPVQKELIEDLFKKKLLKVVFATETLAAGINMPARTVVISSPDKPSSNPTLENGRRLLTPNEFHQMSGRAGRRGIDQVGHVFTMCVNSSNEEDFKNLVVSEPNPIYSMFEPSYSLIINYHKYTKDSEKIKNIFANSFKVFATEESKNAKKINSIHKKYEAKSDVLAQEGFLCINREREKTPTAKGELLPNIIGYPQIQLINLITSHGLQKATPEDLAFLAGAIVGGLKPKQNPEENIENALTQPSTGIKNTLFSLRRHLNDNPAKLDNSVIDTVIKNYSRIQDHYNYTLEDNHLERDNTEPDIKTGAFVHAFAYLNSQNSHSISNWRAIASILPEHGTIKDEGGYYNIINQSIDLLGQMIDTCNAAKNIYEFKNDSMYYKILADKLKIAILLLKQEPIQSYQYEKD